MSVVLELTFIDKAADGDVINFLYNNISTVELVQYAFKTTRSGVNEVTLGVNAITQAQNFVSAFLLDYSALDFSITRIDNVVTITNLLGFDFYEPEILVGNVFVIFDGNYPDVQNNMIHIINMTPRKYVAPPVLTRNYLVTEDNYFILTENNKKIRI